MTIPAGVILTSHPDGRVTYHLGNLFDGTLPFHAGAYSDNGVDVAAHFWNSEWTYRPSPIVAKHTPAEIIAAKRMFPYGDTGATLTPSPDYLPYTGPMSSAWITVYMPTTGERPDIGMITDPGGYFMLGGSLDGVIAAAQAAGSFPHHYRDERTGKPVDITQYPLANCYDNPQGQPWFQRYPLNPDGSNNVGGGMVSQQAHFPELAYIAYQATKDLGFLEECQYSGNYGLLTDAIISTPAGAIMHGEYRGLAWTLRNLFAASAATQDSEADGNLPDSCHPSSYWKTILANQLTYYSKNMADPANQVFHLFAGPMGFAPWQVDYMMTALSFGILTGHSDWSDFYLWNLKNTIDRTSGDSGYPVGWGTAYYMDGTLPDWYSSWLAMAPGLDSPPPPQAAIDALKADPYGAGNGYLPYDSANRTSASDYLKTTRAVLVMADYLEKLGLVNVRALYPLDKCLSNVQRMIVAANAMNPRVAVVSPTLIIQPPPTEITMASTKLAIGETKHSTLAVTPGGADETGLTYTASPDGLVTLAPDATGVNVTGVAVGTAIITASLNGLTATAEADVAAPLALSIALSWDS